MPEKQISNTRGNLGCGVFAALLALGAYVVFFAPQEVDIQSVCTEAARQLKNDQVVYAVEGFQKIDERHGRVNMLVLNGASRLPLVFDCAVSGSNAKNARASLTPGKD